VDPLEFLLGLEVLGMKFGLENMRLLCAALGHPEAAFRSVIVAGTNGKGSVTAMASAALHAAGYRVARYTSPHLQRLEERFVIGEREVTTEELRQAAGTLESVVERLVAERTLEALPTFFECTTAVAFELFRRAGVDIAVLEVGLGGRLDATNVVTPIAAAVTSIDLDHQAQLGDSIEEIAREKAGVIKPGVPVVIGQISEPADRVIAAVSAEQGSRLIRVGVDVRLESRLDADGQTFLTVRTRRRHLHDVPLGLRGMHQAANAALAIGLLDELPPSGFAVDDRAARAGLSDVRWPGRLERFRWHDSEILLDAAHNPAGARALAEYLRAIGWTDAALVFGAMRDKDIRGMLEVLAPAASVLICTTPGSRRALAADEVARRAATLPDAPRHIEIVAAPEAALELAVQHGRRIVIAGSIFLIGPLRGILR
jgi:dihydrofolate synthase/folylpolyglutamate synthase